MARFSRNPYAGGVGRSEHVSLESDLSETRAKPNPGRPLASYALNKGGRGVTQRVSILPDHYVAVEFQRTRSVVDLITVDLRFVDSKPVAVRKVSWRVLHVAIGFTLLLAASAAMYVMLPKLAHALGGILTLVGLGLLTIACYVLCYCLTTESLLFASVHGRARVIVIAGRLGTIRRAHACAADVIAHIKLAQKQFKQSRPAYLRDEMREHTRLYEQGAFTEEQYNDAKRRILKAHE